MILIADSGSTKTTWMEVESGNMIVTEGLNPHFTSDEQFLAACQLVKGDTHSSTTALQWSPSPNLGEELDTKAAPSDSSPKLGEVDTEGGRRSVSVYFYGAGCGSEVQRKRVKTLLQKAFETKNVEVETDMLGACRAVCGDQPGIVGILGTGSNACLYDGHRIRYKPFSTGYILGDTGSANHVGRILLNGYLTHRMPGKLRRMFHDTYRMSDAQFIDAVYHQPNPNRFLASLAVFAAKHQEEDYCSDVIVDAISFWYFEVLKPLYWHRSYFHDTEWDGSVHLVGGFAMAIEPLLKVLFEEGPIHLASVVADPIEGLRQYHIKNF